MATTLVSWNLKGSADPPTDAIAAHLRDEGADVVVLQEVQWHQCRRIAGALAARSRRWGFKHWPVRTWPEGMAVLGVSVPVRASTRALSHAWELWSWRRRILQVARVDPGTPATWTLVNVHLTPHGNIGLRAVETATVTAVVAERARPVVVAGDLNERPSGAVHGQLAAAGLHDGWSVRRPDQAGAGQPATTATTATTAAAAGSGSGATRGRAAPRPDPWPTNWSRWRRGTTEPPTQQLDYVYTSDGIRLLDIRTPPASEHARFAAISDHLPVTAVLEVG